MGKYINQNLKDQYCCLASTQPYLSSELKIRWADVEIILIVKEYGIPVIDDCIEAFGSEYKGKKLGSLETDVTVFSLTAL